MEDEGFTYAQACDYLEPYECIPYVENGVHMATLLKLNAEVHFAGYKEFRGKGYVNARRLKEFFLPILESEGFLITKLATGESDKFILRLGFEQIGESQTHRHYILNAIKPLEKSHD